MALDADTILDRRRMSRRLATWRAIAIFGVLATIGGAIAFYGNVGPRHVARLPISGAIVAEQPFLDLVESLGKRRDVAGVVLAINSPGGTSTGGEKLYRALRALDETTPVVAQIGTVGASAAYMAALASDHIVAQRTSLTGSVGVLIQYGQVNELLDKLGISIGKVDSGALKAEPNPFEPVQPDAVAALQSVVDDTFMWFLDLVKERRGLGDDDVSTIASGRIFTGAQALSEGLIDEIGGEDTAIAWLEEERGMATNLPVRTYRPAGDGTFSVASTITDTILRRVLASVGITLPALPATGSVDGLWSLWHPSNVNGMRGGG